MGSTNFHTGPNRTTIMKDHRMAGHPNIMRPALRARLEQAVERIIAALGALDGDADQEDGGDLEDNEMHDDCEEFSVHNQPQQGGGAWINMLAFDGDGQAIANNMLRRIRTRIAA